MSQSTSSVDSLTRPRVAVAVATALLALSVGYYSYLVRSSASSEASSAHFVTSLPGGGLHRSNAVRRSRRPRGSDDAGSTSSAEGGHGDENAHAHATAADDAAAAEDAVNHVAAQQPAGDGETVVEASADDWFNDQGALPSSQRAGHNIVNLLFRVSEDNARRNGCVHRGCQCNACGMVPIRGVRYRCANCADFDLCETCEAQGIHIKTHVFYKIRVPAPPFGPRQMQPVWYTGDPDTCRRNLPRGLIAKLSRETGFERPELEAFWEQWTFMANTEWRDDPDDLGIAMDRKTFERCLVPTGGSRHASPNLIHDRMFSFYDSNKDDLIGFSEFLQGLSYRKRKDKLRKVFDGYDIDGDKYVNRRDFLRMFRAYYVLYKQMHKDILDGLEDQLLASTEAQHLVTSRQPLSSLFGREGRVPSAMTGLRYEGKTYRPDGSVDVDSGYEHAVVPDPEDTARRGDILTSLFAYSDQESRHQFSGVDGDSNWRSVRRLSGNDADRAYWATLLEPPTSLEELPRVLINNLTQETDTEEEDEDDEEEDDDDDDDDDDELEDQDGEEVEEENDDGQEDDEDEEDEEEQEEGEGEGGDGDDEHQEQEAEDEHDGTIDGEARDSDSNPFAAGRALNDSELRASYISHIRNLAPKLEKRRRDMARKQLHERWKRRQFYLDEEEGGEAPDDWKEEEDVFATNPAGESSKTANQRPPIRSRSSSKVRFAEDADDLETRSNASVSSRGLPERWGGIDISYAERDAGKEILYQVTQQAFNELLDTIFKPAEDLAAEAAESAAQRERYRHLIEALDADEEEEEEEEDEVQHRRESKARAELVRATQAQKPVSEMTIQELLDMTGYTVETPEKPRNAVEIDAPVHVSEDGEVVEEAAAVGAEATETTDDREDVYRDPTLPQFRPNSESSSLSTPIPKSSSSRSLSSSLSRNTSPTSVGGGKKDGDEGAATGTATTSGPSESEPTTETLRRWRELNAAEAEAAKRGGWGRLSFEEFEEIYKRQEHQGNRLDYLGSWIDFCIP